MMVNQHFFFFPFKNQPTPIASDPPVLFCSRLVLKAIAKVQLYPKAIPTPEMSQMYVTGTQGAWVWHVNAMRAATYPVTCPVGSQEQFPQAKMVHIGIPFEIEKSGGFVHMWFY